MGGVISFQGIVSTVLSPKLKKNPSQINLTLKIHSKYTQNTLKIHSEYIPNIPKTHSKYAKIHTKIHGTVGFFKSLDQESLQEFSDYIYVGG